MDRNDNLVDLTVSRGPDNRTGDSYSDEEDEAAFEVSLSHRRLYNKKIWKLRHNDPNFGLLRLGACDLDPPGVCSRIGAHLTTSRHVKNLMLGNCGLTESKMEMLFGRIARQNEVNEYILKRGILERLGVTERTLVDGVIDGVTSFRGLWNVNISCNSFGSNGLDFLIKSLAGSPIEELDISRCELRGVRTLKGLRKCTALKLLNMSGNNVGVEDFDAVKVLFDNGYPKLRELRMDSCGVGDDLIELISPVLRKNKSMIYLHLMNNNNGQRNAIGDRGAAALCNAVHNSSSFEKTMESNHTILKIMLDYQGANNPIRKCNYWYGSNPFNVAWRKYVSDLASIDTCDTSPFMEEDIKLIPRLLANIHKGRYGRAGADTGLSAYFKIWSCKMFRERIKTASQISTLQARNEKLNTAVKSLESSQSEGKRRCEELEDENSKLKQQLAKLMAQNAKPGSKSKRQTDTVSGSIAERVKKMRKSSGKRGRKYR